MDMFERADHIEKIVCRDYGDANMDAADLALHEIAIDPNRSNEEIARQVAMRILQP
jgi:hypothetical protein